jgi:hypothetical protein
MSGFQMLKQMDAHWKARHEFCPKTQMFGVLASGTLTFTVVDQLILGYSVNIFTSTLCSETKTIRHQRDDYRMSF